MRWAQGVTDPHRNLIVCEDCGNYWCLACEEHWVDCPCPGPDDQQRQEVEPRACVSCPNVYTGALVCPDCGEPGEPIRSAT